MEKKTGDNLKLEQKRNRNGQSDTDTYNLEKKGNNEYKKGSDRFIIKSVSSNILVVDYYDNYYSSDDDDKEFGVYTFMK